MINNIFRLLPFQLSIQVQENLVDLSSNMQTLVGSIWTKTLSHINKANDNSIEEEFDSSQEVVIHSEVINKEIELELKQPSSDSEESTGAYSDDQKEPVSDNSSPLSITDCSEIIDDSDTDSVIVHSDDTGEIESLYSSDTETDTGSVIFYSEDISESPSNADIPATNSVISHSEESSENPLSSDTQSDFDGYIVPGFDYFNEKDPFEAEYLEALDAAKKLNFRIRY